mgnify:CR=1 FL=1
MKFKLKRIDWYIIKQFLGTYIFAIALIIAISVVFDINEKIDKFLSPDVPLKAIVFDYYMNFIPYFANLFSPLFTFIAVSYNILLFITGSSSSISVPYCSSTALYVSPQ